MDPITIQFQIKVDIYLHSTNSVTPEIMGREDDQRVCLQDAIRELLSEWFGICFENSAHAMTWEHLLQACKTNEGKLNHDQDQDQLEENKEEEKTMSTLNSIIEQELTSAIKIVLRDYSPLVEIKERYDNTDSFDQTMEFYLIGSGKSRLIDPIMKKLNEKRFDDEKENDDEILDKNKIYKQLVNKFEETIMNGNKEYQNQINQFKICDLIKHNDNTNEDQPSWTLVHFVVTIDAKLEKKTFWKCSKTHVTMRYMDKYFKDRQALLTFVHQCVTDIKEQKYASLKKQEKYL